MAGFERRKVYVLEFPEDSEFHGLVIRARPLTAGAALAVAGEAADAGETEKIDGADRVFRALAGCPDWCTTTHDELPPGQEHYLNRLISWNLEEDGAPVPCHFDGLMSQDLDLVRAVADAWQEAAFGTPAPLDGNSNAGGPWAEGSIPMETLSDAPQP